jgi:hypothetical protein
VLSCPVTSDLQYDKVSQRRLCALGVSALDFASAATPLFSAYSALFALLVARCSATNHLESTSSALFCKDQGVGTSLLIPSIGRQRPFSLTPVFATHPKKAPVTPLLATLPKTRVLKVLCLPHIQKMAGEGDILLTKFPMRESVLSDRRESKDQYPFSTDASSTNYCGAPCGRELQPLFHLSTERGALAYD